MLTEKHLAIVRAALKFLHEEMSNEAGDVSVTNILPKDRRLNKERGCAAVSIGEKCHRSISTFMAKRFSK